MTSETVVVEADPDVVELQGEADVFIETITTTEVVERDGEIIVESVVQSEVIDLPSTQEVFDAGSQGPPGPQGQIGPVGGTAYERTTSGALSALVVVWEDGSGIVRPIDYMDDDHIDLILGLTITATPSAGPVNVQRDGTVDNGGWSWSPGRVWLGANGTLTQTPAAIGSDVLIGRAVSATRLLLDLQDPIDLE